MGRRTFTFVLAILLCAGGLAVFGAIRLIPMVPGWMAVAIGASALLVVFIPAYLLIRPPDFDDNDDEDSGGGGKRPPPERPEPPTPRDGLPLVDWGGFDDARRDWERPPVSA
jgi:hypothetical protein